MVNRGCWAMFGIFMTTSLVPFKEALECMVGEYEVDAQCCPTCPPGYKVDEICSVMTGTKCLPCDPGTYTAHHHGRKECLQCKVCDPEVGLVTRKECSLKSNTVCNCFPGHFCADMKDDECELCEPYRVCIPGQYVRSRGTERSNTICEKCQAGTFSPNGTLDQCLPWTNCTAQGLFEQKPGTDTMDALCSTQSSFHLHSVIIIVFSVVITCILIAFIASVALFRRKKKLKKGYNIKQKDEAFHHEKTCVSLEVDGSVINLPVQETRHQKESVPLKERMPKNQDSGEP